MKARQGTVREGRLGWDLGWLQRVAEEMSWPQEVKARAKKDQRGSRLSVRLALGWGRCLTECGCGRNRNIILVLGTLPGDLKETWRCLWLPTPEAGGG